MNPSSSDCNPNHVHERVADDEDDRNKYDAADRGHEYDGLGFLRFSSPSSNVETLPVPSEEPQEAPQMAQGKVIASITPTDEMRLYGDLYASYGHPGVVKAKVAYVWGLTAVCVYLMTHVALSPLSFCVLGGIVAAVGVSYILSSTWS